MKTFKICRDNLSTCLNPDFQEREKNALQKIEGIVFSQDRPDILITNTLTDTSKLDTKGLKLILHPNSGYDNFSYQFVKKANFPIIIGNQVRADAVCEYILSCLFHRFSKIPNQSNWDRSWPNRRLLKNQSVLVMGYGHIGKKIHQALSPLVKELFVFDPYVAEQVVKEIKEVPLSKCSVIILAQSLNPTNIKSIDAVFLQSLPKEITLINAARGKLIDQKALLTFLEKNPLSFAFLDVFEKEPCRLPARPNLNQTSHMAGVFDHLDNNIISFEKEVLNNFLNSPNFETIYSKANLKNRLFKHMLL